MSRGVAIGAAATLALLLVPPTGARAAERVSFAGDVAAHAARPSAGEKPVTVVLTGGGGRIDEKFKLVLTLTPPKPPSKVGTVRGHGSTTDGFRLTLSGSYSPRSGRICCRGEDTFRASVLFDAFECAGFFDPETGRVSLSFPSRDAARGSGYIVLPGRAPQPRPKPPEGGTPDLKIVTVYELAAGQPKTLDAIKQFQNLTVDPGGGTATWTTFGSASGKQETINFQFTVPKNRYVVGERVSISVRVSDKTAERAPAYIGLQFYGIPGVKPGDRASVNTHSQDPPFNAPGDFTISDVGKNLFVNLSLPDAVLIVQWMYERKERAVPVSELPPELRGK